MHLSERQRFKQLHFTAVMAHKLYRLLLRMYSNLPPALQWMGCTGWWENIDYVVFAWNQHVNRDQKQRHQVVRYLNYHPWASSALPNWTLPT